MKRYSFTAGLAGTVSLSVELFPSGELPTPSGAARNLYILRYNCTNQD